MTAILSYARCALVGSTTILPIVFLSFCWDVANGEEPSSATSEARYREGPCQAQDASEAFLQYTGVSLREGGCDSQCW